MSKRPMDLEAIRQARDNLDRIARENPHMIDHARANCSDESEFTVYAIFSETGWIFHKF